MILIAVIIIPYALIMGVKLPRRATVVVLTGEPEELKMEWKELIEDETLVEENPWIEVEMDSEGLFDVDEFYTYWMNVADPRGAYLETLAAFKFEQASGSGEWDY